MMSFLLLSLVENKFLEVVYRHHHVFIRDLRFESFCHLVSCHKVQFLNLVWLAQVIFVRLHLLVELRLNRVESVELILLVKLRHRSLTLARALSDKPKILN